MSIKAISRDNVHLICSAQVILSPAIALKELLENALDAKATNIEVKLQEYGTKMITVVDNGCGIKEADFVGLSKYMNFYFLKADHFSYLYQRPSIIPANCKSLKI